MSNRRKIDELDRGRITTEAVALVDPVDGPEDPDPMPATTDAPPRLRVRTIEPTAIIRFENAEILFEESAVRAVAAQLNRLVEAGHTRLLVNLGGVRYLSSDMLGLLAGLQKKLGPAQGRIQLCGLEPLVRDMVRVIHLDRVLDVCDDEAEALGLMLLRSSKAPE